MAEVAYNWTLAENRPALHFERVPDGASVRRGHVWVEHLPASPIQSGYRYPTLAGSYRVGFGVTAPRAIVHAVLHAATADDLETFLALAYDHAARPTPLWLRDHDGRIITDCVLVQIEQHERQRAAYVAANDGSATIAGKLWPVRFTFERQRVAIGE